MTDQEKLAALVERKAKEYSESLRGNRGAETVSLPKIERLAYIACATDATILAAVIALAKTEAFEDVLIATRTRYETEMESDPSDFVKTKRLVEWMLEAECRKFEELVK